MVDTPKPKLHRQKTRTPGNPRHAEARDVPRVVVEVDVLVNMTLLGRYLPVGLARIELYRDELPGVLDSVRTPEHEEQKARAEAMVQHLREEFEAEHSSALRSMKPEAAEKWTYEHFLLGWVSFLPLVGGSKRGIPSLKSASVVALDEELTVPVAEFLELDPVEQRAFLRAPPATGFNTTKLANDHIAQVLRRAMTRTS